MKTWRGLGAALAVVALACGGVESASDSGADSGTDAPADARPEPTDAKDDTASDAAHDGAFDAQADATADGAGDAALDGSADGGPADVVVADAIKPDVSVIDAGPPDVQPPLDGGICNALANGASPVTMMQSNGPKPVPQGGSVVTGLYYMTTLTWFNGKTGSAGVTAALTIDVANGTLQSVVTQNAQTDRASFTWTASQTTWAMAETCPSNMQSSGGYTATQNALALYFDDGQGNLVEEAFTRQ